MVWVPPTDALWEMTMSVSPPSPGETQRITKYMRKREDQDLWNAGVRFRVSIYGYRSTEIRIQEVFKHEKDAENLVQKTLRKINSIPIAKEAGFGLITVERFVSP